MIQPIPPHFEKFDSLVDLSLSFFACPASCHLPTLLERTSQHSTAQQRKKSRYMGNAKSMSLGPDAAAIVTKAVASMPSPPMIETGIFAAGKYELCVIFCLACP